MKTITRICFILLSGLMILTLSECKKGSDGTLNQNLSDTTSKPDFINYKLDGVDYSYLITNPVNTVIVVSDSEEVASKNYYILYAYTVGGTSSFNIDFHCTSAGTAPITKLYLNQIEANTQTIPLLFNITHFPGNMSEPFQGNFSGHFADTTGVTHSLELTFSVHEEE